MYNPCIKLPILLVMGGGHGHMHDPYPGEGVGGTLGITGNHLDATLQPFWMLHFSVASSKMR